MRFLLKLYNALCKKYEYQDNLHTNNSRNTQCLKISAMQVSDINFYAHHKKHADTHVSI